MTATASYDIHGVHVVAETAEGSAIDSLDRRLGLFRAPVGSATDVRLELGIGPLKPPPGESRPVYDAPHTQVAYFDDADELYVEHLGVRLRCAPEAGLVRLSWPRGDATDIWVATHPLLTIALIEVLKRRGRYSLHAACAAAAGRGLLVAGPSGAGKSTLSIALAQVGWDFVSDDMVFLTATPSGTDVLGFPDEVDVTEATLAMFPGLAPHARPPLMAGRAKASLRLEEALGSRPLLRCPPTVLVLAGVAHRRDSTLSRVSPAEALVELAPNVLLTQAAATQAHLAALGDLVEQIPCYRLETGRDLGQVERMLAEILADTPEAASEVAPPPAG